MLLRDTAAQLAKGNVRAEDVIDERYEATSDIAGYVNGATAMRWMRDHPLNDELARISVPVLVVAGERDVVCPPRAAEIMLEHLPNAEYEQVAGVGHLLNDESPATVTAILRRWFEREERP